MSDFFEGLAARSSGAAMALRPRVTSAYETPEPPEIVEEEVPAPAMPEGTQAVNVAPEQTRTQDPAERDVVRDVVLPRAQMREAPPWIPLDDSVEQRAGRARDHAHEHTTHDEMIENVRELPAALHPPEPRPEPHPPSSPVREVADGRPEALPPRRPQPPLPHQTATSVRRPPLTIRQPASVHRPPVLDRQPQPDPVVRITIGRIEVRAIQPAPPAPRPASPPVPPGPTLAEFLEERERRK